METNHHRRILLVEDDSVSAFLLTAQLQKEGYSVLRLADGESAVAFFRSQKEPVDLILMDINLGEGMDGTVAAQEILKCVDLPILFLSSHTEKKVVEKTELISSYGYVVKNSGEIVLGAAIKMALRLFESQKREKETTRALQESEAFFRAVTDHLPFGIAVNSVHPQVEFTYMNESFPKIYRTTMEALQNPDGFWSAAYEDPVFRETLRTRVLSDCDSGNPEQMVWESVPLTRKGEETTYISAQNIPIKEKGLMVSVVWDVTKQQRYEEALKEREERYRLLVENQQDLIVKTDAFGNILYVNPAYCLMFGKSEAEILGHPFFPIVHPDDRPIIEEARKKSNRPPYQVVYNERAWTVNGWRWLACSEKAILNEAGVAEAFIASLRDITDQRNAEIALKKALKEKDTLLRDFQHRTKNSLNMIANMITLKMLSAKSDELRNSFEDLSARIQSVSELYTLLYETGSFEEVDLAAYFEKIVGSMRTTLNDVEIESRLDQAVVSVKAAANLGFILAEFIVNAVKHAFPQGRRGHILLTLSREGSHYRLTVEDNGIGFPKGFNPEKTEGTGLNIVKSIVEQIDGQLTLQTHNGAKIAITFPVEACGLPRFASDRF
ncbi:MAG TPA: PAS domain S-box protein [Thermotogota bacterium]|nr:PAS domain S-box protein [Thermotogota bacterium]